MLDDIENGAAAAARLVGGAPLHSTLDVASPADWLALDAGVREVTWHHARFLPGWGYSASLPADVPQLGESRLALALCHRDGRIRGPGCETAHLGRAISTALASVAGRVARQGGGA